VEKNEKKAKKLTKRSAPGQSARSASSQDRDGGERASYPMNCTLERKKREWGPMGNGNGQGAVLKGGKTAARPTSEVAKHREIICTT